MTHRRDVLAGLGALPFLTSASWADLGKPVAGSGARTAGGQDVFVGLCAQGNMTFEVPLPARGHAAAAHPKFAELVAIARRPGAFSKVIECSSGRILHVLNAPVGRHFYGHAAFSVDGQHLFTTENDIETGEGRIGVWDRSLRYARVGEFSSGGIGPHEVILLSSGALAVANGGIRTHPDSGREALNLATMRANLTILSQSGEILNQAFLPQAERLNSVRHIAEGPDDAILCGLQWQGDLFETPSLLALFDPQAGLYPIPVSDTLLRKLKGYIGSVAALGDTGFAASAPRGNRILSVSQAGEVFAEHKSEDACGIARLGSGKALVTNGLGQVMELSSGRLETVQSVPLRFDNHLIAL